MTKFADKVDKILSDYGTPPKKIQLARNEVIDLFLDLYHYISKDIQTHYKKRAGHVNQIISKAFEKTLNR